MIDARENLCPRDHGCIPLEPPPKVSRPVGGYLILFSLVVWGLIPLGLFLGWITNTWIDAVLAFFGAL